MKIEFEQKKRPALHFASLRMVNATPEQRKKSVRALFYGTTLDGKAIIEFENGIIRQCDLKDLKLLDSPSEFSKYYFGEHE